jgi:iron complex transport system substrate-binding protein
VEVGEACGRGADATKTMIALRARFCDARDHVNPYVDGPRTAVIEWTEPLHLAGLWTPGLIAAAGGQPLGPSLGEPSRAIDPGVLIAAKPERIIVAPCGVRADAIGPHLDALTSTDWWSELPAVARAHVQVLDGTSSFSRPGPRLIDTFEWLVQWLSHPAAEPDLPKAEEEGT